MELWRGRAVKVLKIIARNRQKWPDPPKKTRNTIGNWGELVRFWISHTCRSLNQWQFYDHLTLFTETSTLPHPHKNLHCQLLPTCNYCLQILYRLWGDHGQKKLESAKVCLINATALGTEILKNLVLPGMVKNGQK